MDTSAKRTPIVDLAADDLWAGEAGVRRAFAVLRADQPVSWQPKRRSEEVTPGPGYWAVVRHEDVQQVSTVPDLWVSPGPHVCLGAQPTNRHEIAAAFTARRQPSLHGPQPVPLPRRSPPTTSVPIEL
jgi:methyl-branched lipid omega-hydroxylase